MRRSVFFSFVALVALAAATAITAQIVPQGGVIPVGSMNIDNRDVTTLPSGDFVVVWSDGGYYIEGTLVSGGTPGAPFQVSTYNYSFPFNPRVDSDDNGDFWVVWKDSSEIRGRGFDSTTNPLAAPFQVSGVSTYSPQVGARRSAGGFVATYDDFLAGYTRARGFDGTGTEDFAPVDATYSSNTRLAVDPDGNFMVVWSGDYLTAATFDPTGTPITQFNVASPSSPFDVAALGADQFVVTWSEYLGSPTPYQVVAQLTSTTANVGSPIPVAGTDYYAGVAVSGNADYFVVVWHDYSYGLPAKKTAGRGNAMLPFASGDVNAQAFTSGGSALGTPTIMNPGYPALGFSNIPAVSMNSGSQFTVLWNNYGSAYAAAGVVCPPAVAPTLVSPVGGAVVNSPVTFSWNAVAGAVSYEVFAGTDPASPTSVGTTAGTTLGPIALSAGSGSWYVVADFGAGCPTAQSATETFLVCAVATAPTLSSPISGASVSSPVTFSWNAVAGATMYDLYVGVDATPTLVGSTAVTTFGPLALSPGSGSWYVVANFGAGCPTAQSATETFLVCSTATAPTLVSPVGGTTTNSPVTFSWNAVTGATSYDVYVGVDAAPTLAGSTAGTSLGPLALSNGSGSWYVVANFETGCPTAQSATETFQVCPTATAPTLASPIGGASVSSPVTFTWNAVSGAVSYDLYVGVDASPSLLASGIVGTSHGPVALSSGSGNWYVIANFDVGCPTAQSTSETFLVCSTATAPALSSPVSGASVSSPVTFSWTAVTGAVSYDLYVGVGTSPSLLASGITGTSHGPVALSSGSGTWYVVAHFETGCPTAQSATETFQVCPTATAPTLVSPVGGASVTSPVTFSWNSVAGAISYDLFVGVGTSPSFQENTTSTSSSPISLPLGAGDWYVIANFGTGCPTASSAIGTFNVTASCPTLGTPTLVSPAAAATVTSPVTFSWNPASGATSYELFVGSLPSPALAGTTAGTSLTISVGDGTKVWYVVAKSSASCPTTQSALRTVNVQSACPAAVPPTLVAPPDGAEVDEGSLVRYEWSPVSGAVDYLVLASVNGGPVSTLGTTTSTFLERTIDEGTTVWHVVARFGSTCGTATSASRSISTKSDEPPPPECGLTIQPLASIVGEATTGENYVLHWEEITGIRKFRVQESANDLFTQIITERTIEDARQTSFAHPELTLPTPFYYRVAGIAECPDGDKIGPYSKVVRVVGLPKPAPSSTNPQIVTEFGNDEIVETSLFIPGFGESSKTTSVATFSVNSNEPWVTVVPSSGELPPDGVTVLVQADPGDLGVGANTATLTVTRDDGLGKTISGSTTTSVPIAVSLVTPVTPIGKTAGPPENSLIIPAVANVTGLNSKWFSDVKVTNRATQPIIYQLNFSATDQSGIVEGKQTKVTIRPGQTVALDDVVRQWYGLGDLADGTNGALEIRPLNFNGKVGPEAAPMLATVASSRTYTRQENSLASFGQFIPAVPFSSFLKSGVQDALLMMQQVSQTESLRTNFGIVEGGGKEVNVLLTAYDKQGTKLGEFPVSLKAGEHKQLNSLLALNGIVVEDGRMSAQIVSGEGAITAYASVVAAGTGDPALVPGVDPSSISAKKYVLPGVADLRIGAANWRSDVRIFNPNPNAETVNVFFYPQGETTPLGPVEIQIQPGHIEVLPDVVESLFGQQDLGGALHIVPITGQETSLIISGETYDVSELGKYGQFIPAATEANAIGIGTPGLEIMQVESSAQFRTNLGIAEVTGQSATVQIQLTVPNSLIAPTRTVTLEGNEFEQLNGIVKDMAGGRDVYNGRLTVRVVGGAGRITAYGSTVDNQTQDATFSAGQ